MTTYAKQNCDWKVEQLSQVASQVASHQHWHLSEYWFQGPLVFFYDFTLLWEIVYILHYCWPFLKACHRFWDLLKCISPSCQADNSLHYFNVLWTVPTTNLCNEWAHNIHLLLSLCCFSINRTYWPVAEPLAIVLGSAFVSTVLHPLWRQVPGAEFWHPSGGGTTLSCRYLR